MFHNQITAETTPVAGWRLPFSDLRSEISSFRSTLCRLHAASLAAVVALAAVGCGNESSRDVAATQVILPGEQSFTIPEVPEEATPATTPEASGSASETAGESTSNTPSTAASNTAESTPPTGAPAESSTAAPATTGSDKALFTGRVTVAGTPPTLSPVMNKGNPNVKDTICVAQDTPDESVIVGDGGGLANVFVFAKKVPAGVEVPPPPTEPAAMDQVNCRFVPQAMVFRVGQPLLMKNSDPVAHNVRANGLTQTINQIIAPSDQTGIPLTYSRPERVPVQTKCDIHAWMSAYHLPLDHPWAAVTGPDGTFEIKDLPPGDWEFVVWHGRVGNVKSVKLKAAAGQVVRQDFSVPAAELSP
jgi:hypothetical protein